MPAQKDFSARNVLCPLYSRCLDRAVRRNAAGFSCAECRHQNDKVPADDLIADLPGALLVLLAVFSRTNPRIRALWDEHRRQACNVEQLPG